MTALTASGITTPFPIPAATLPDSLAGRDVLGRGRTGSGKTVAFAAPMVAALATKRRPRTMGRPRALILVPTRELATQVAEVTAPLAAAFGLRTITAFGGIGQRPQVTAAAGTRRWSRTTSASPSPPSPGGYHVLLHDGPRQGRLLIEEGLPLRHGWEHVVTPVVDAALQIDVVDPDRIVYQPWSLGGYMAPRVAAYEHRLAAIVADPGQLDVCGKFVPGLQLLGMSTDALAKLPAMDPADAEKALDAINGIRSLHRSVVQRGFWANGTPDLPSFLVEMWKWKLTPEEVAQIRCPTLVTWGQSDRASTNAKDLYDALTCPTELLQFTDADGAGMHCEMLNRSMASRQILD